MLWPSLGSSTDAKLPIALVHAVNFYLDETTSVQIQAITAKGKLDENDQAMMQGFVLEALRIDPPFTGAYRAQLSSCRDERGS